MAANLWALVLPLLLQGCLGIVGQTNTGCMKWTQQGNNVCCELCHPGHHLGNICGPNPKDLCIPCESNTYTVDPASSRCNRCTQCVGAQVQLKECTSTTDTKCGCKKGLICGDEKCTFCVLECKKGQEPTEDRSCRPCPDGTFNNQNHQMCKPWSTKCPNPNEKIVAMGDAFTDIKCENFSVDVVVRPKEPGQAEEALPWILIMVVTVLLLGFFIIIISIMTAKLHQKRKTTKKTITKLPIISTPTDDPRTLIAIECSFHEAQQEQGSSSESLASKDSTEQLIG